MIIQNYFVIENNVVTNDVVWDGDVNTWQPPANATMLMVNTTSAIIWEPVIVDKQITDYVLTEVIGAGNIGFTWSGTVLTTNEPKPAVPT